MDFTNTFRWIARLLYEFYCHSRIYDKLLDYNCVQSYMQWRVVEFRTAYGYLHMPVRSVYRTLTSCISSKNFE